MSSWRAGSASRRPRACGESACSKRRASSRAIAGCSTKSYSALRSRCSRGAPVEPGGSRPLGVRGVRPHAPVVRECWMLSGETDFILKWCAPTLAAFQAFVAELTGAPNVRNVKTSLVLRNAKDDAMVPLELARHDGLAAQGRCASSRILPSHSREAWNETLPCGGACRHHARIPRYGQCAGRTISSSATSISRPPATRWRSAASTAPCAISTRSGIARRKEIFEERAEGRSGLRHGLVGHRADADGQSAQRDARSPTSRRRSPPIEKAKAMNAKTERERDYIDALARHVRRLRQGSTHLQRIAPIRDARKRSRRNIQTTTRRRSPTPSRSNTSA